MGILQLSTRGLNPLGQTETGLAVPTLGARKATFLGGLVVAAVTLLTGWKFPSLSQLRWEGAGVAKIEDVGSSEKP